MHDSAAGPAGRREVASEPGVRDEPGGRWLVLLRHAKSAYPEGVDDHERPLAPRGRREAALAGAWLAAIRPPIDAVVCSDARRALDTLRRTGIAAPPRLDGRLYGASAGQIIALLTELPASTRTVLVVAHAPGLPQAAAALAGPDSDPAAVAALRGGFPTAAIALLAVPGAWSALSPGTCRLVTVHVPRA